MSFRDPLVSSPPMVAFTTPGTLPGCGRMTEMGAHYCAVGILPAELSP